MKAIGVGLVMVLWSVIGACLYTELNDWMRERLERNKKGSWVCWLAVND